MRGLVICMTLCVLAAIVPAVAYAQPPLPEVSVYSPSVAPFDITCGAPDCSVPGQYKYTWNVTFNGSCDLYGNCDQYMQEFLVYDPAPPATLIQAWDTIICPGSKFVGWDASAGGANVLVQWKAEPAGQARLCVCEDCDFVAAFDQPLKDPILNTAIKVQFGEDSEWCCTTPELPAPALLLIGMVPLGIAYMRRRKG